MYIKLFLIIVAKAFQQFYYSTIHILGLTTMAETNAQQAKSILEP